MRRDALGRGEYRARSARRAARRALLLLTATILATGCALFFKSPKVSIADVRVATVGLVGGTAEVQLNVINPNGFELVAREFRYRLSYSDDDADRGWRMLTEGESDEEVVVAANDSASVRLSVPFRYADVGRALSSLMSQGELRYRLEGDVKFDAPITDIRVPFDRRGSFLP